jgi:antitoxin MazE
MIARIQKWGNSLALRIPKAFATEAGLAEDVSVELTLQNGKVVVKPVTEPPIVLSELLRDIKPGNLHGEWETGHAVGKELW